MPQGRARFIYSGAPHRPSPPPVGQRLLTHDGYAPPPKIEIPDGLQALEAEIASTEERLALMRERLGTLKLRDLQRRPTMASVNRVREPLVGRRL